MPGFLLDVNSQVFCAHMGMAKPFLQLARVKVMGAPAVGETTPYTISGCTFTTAGAPTPCTMAMSWQGEATRVRAMGVFVLLATSQATCIPNGVPTTVIPVQARVKGT